MTREIVIEENNSINVDLINPESKGIILTYNGDKLSGYILYDSDINYWIFHNKLNFQYPTCIDVSLKTLISVITERKLATNFKLIDIE